MTIYLLRHAKARQRSSWTEADWVRPLTPAGQEQARILLTTLHDARFAHIFSSPYVRCMESVVPLASLHGLPIEPLDVLAEGVTVEGALALVKEHGPAGAVLCSHGDIIPAVLEHLAANGTDLGTHPRCEKGSIWAIDDDDDVDGPATARYIPAT